MFFEHVRALNLLPNKQILIEMFKNVQGLFAISTGIIFASRNVVLVILATGTTGLLLTTIQVLPYSLISQYQKDATVSPPKTDTFFQSIY